MGAAVPNYMKLHEMGKLPVSARGNVPMLKQIDALQKKLDDIEKGCCDDCKLNLFGIEKPGHGKPKKEETKA